MKVVTWVEMTVAMLAHMKAEKSVETLVQQTDNWKVVKRDALMAALSV